jgi:hypothetical protein
MHRPAAGASMPAVTGAATQFAPIRPDSAAAMPALGALHRRSEWLDQHVILPVIYIDGARITAGAAGDVERPHAKLSHLCERNRVGRRRGLLAGWLLAHVEETTRDAVRFLTAAGPAPPVMAIKAKAPRCGYRAMKPRVGAVSGRPARGPA